MKIPRGYRYYKLSDLAAICQVNQQTVPNLLAPFKEVQPSFLLEGILKRN